MGIHECMYSHVLNACTVMYTHAVCSYPCFVQFVCIHVHVRTMSYDIVIDRCVLGVVSMGLLFSSYTGS